MTGAQLHVATRDGEKLREQGPARLIGCIVDRRGRQPDAQAAAGPSFQGIATAPRLHADAYDQPVGPGFELFGQGLRKT